MAVGAALYVYHQVLGYPRKFQMGHAYWGPEYPMDHLKEVLDRYGLSYSILEERTGGWFEKNYPSPFMLLAYPVRPEKWGLIPAQLTWVERGVFRR